MLAQKTHFITSLIGWTKILVNYKCKKNPYTDTTGDTKQSRLESTTEITQNMYFDLKYVFHTDLQTPVLIN
jgi:hypothetical protein